MDRTYKDFIVPGGITYPEKVKSPMVYVGRNRVKIVWLRGSDPSVEKACIFWNNYSDSMILDIPPTGDTISAIINSLPEKSYTFNIITYDESGHASVPVELLSAVYGDQYQANLLDRPVKSAVLDSQGRITIEWGGADISNGALATEVKYTDTLGTIRVRHFSVTVESSVIGDMEPGTAFLHRTAFIPDSLSIDTFYTGYIKDSLFLLDKSKWSIIDFSSEYPGREDTKVGRIIDGDPTTRWHTNSGHSSRSDFVTVDMKVERTITNFEIFRDDGDDRACDTFKLFVSKDNVNWTDLGTFPFNRYIDAGQWYAIPSHPKARYWKFVGLPGPEDFMVTGEITVYGL